MQWFYPQIALFIAVLNSAVNPLAYAFFKQDIKKKIKKINLQNVLGKNPVNYRRCQLGGGGGGG